MGFVHRYSCMLILWPSAFWNTLKALISELYYFERDRVTFTAPTSPHVRDVISVVQRNIRQTSNQVAFILKIKQFVCRGQMIIECNDMHTFLSVPLCLNTYICKSFLLGCTYSYRSQTVQQTSSVAECRCLTPEHWVTFLAGQLPQFLFNEMGKSVSHSKSLPTTTAIVWFPFYWTYPPVCWLRAHL